MELVQPEIEVYAEQHTSMPPPEVQDLVKKSDRDLEHIDMLSGRVVGQLLKILIKSSGAKNVLEIGTFTGYSALIMAGALPEEGKIITCEYNKRYEALARQAFENSPHGPKIELRMGKARQTIDALDQTFDFIFLDADKVNYPAYYDAVLPKLLHGGLMVIDNVLWDGNVLAPEDEKSRAINQLNSIIRDDNRVEQVMLTVRDGVTILRKCKKVNS